MTKAAILTLCAFALPAMAAPATTPALTGFPFADESLNYAIASPGGLSLGEAHLRSRRADGNWSFEFTLDAALAGFTVKDYYSAHANADFCGMDLLKQYAHGPNKGAEKETIERWRETASRETLHGGGKGEFPVPDCVKDALTMLFYARREMGQGRVPPAQDILFGGLYRIGFDYVGAPVIQVGGKSVQTDELLCTLKGRASDIRFEVYFARDAARTPVAVKVPLAVGKFSMELVR